MNCLVFGGVRLVTRRLLMFTVAASLAFAVSPVSAQDRIDVQLDRAKVLQLPPHTSVVVLGDPIIADVTLLKRSNSMILTGKSFGKTNLIALDAQGRTLGESLVEVTASSTSLIVQRGLDRQSYACDPRCEPTFNLGDDPDFTGKISGQIQARNALAQPAAH